MKIAIGADHRGFKYKEYIKSNSDAATEWVDVGAYDDRQSDYPVFAHAVCDKMRAGLADYGVLICGSGIGMAVTANRYGGIYAALVWNETVARLSKEHDNANVLVLPSDFIAQEQAVIMVKVWIKAQFLEGKYRHRIQMIDEK